MFFTIRFSRIYRASIGSGRCGIIHLFLVDQRNGKTDAEASGKLMQSFLQLVREQEMYLLYLVGGTCIYKDLQNYNFASFSQLLKFSNSRSRFMLDILEFAMGQI